MFCNLEHHYQMFCAFLYRACPCMYVCTALLKCNVPLAWQWLAHDSNGWYLTLTTRYSLTCECRGVNHLYIALELDPSTTIASSFDEPLHTRMNQYLSCENWHQPLTSDYPTAQLTFNNNSRIVPWMSLNLYRCINVHWWFIILQ